MAGANHALIGGYMFNGIKAVLFDLDGTLVDSMWVWEDIDIEFLGRYGIEHTKDFQKDLNGMSFTETACFFKERFQLPDSVEEIKNAWNVMALDKYTKEVPLKEGAFELIKALKEKGIKLGIASSNSIELVLAVIRRYDLEKYFDSINTSCEVAKGKPAPDIYLHVANKLKVNPEECLVFEDVIQGILAGKNANMKVCAVEDVHSVDTLEEKALFADYVIKSFRELKVN